MLVSNILITVTFLGKAGQQVTLVAKVPLLWSEACRAGRPGTNADNYWQHMLKKQNSEATIWTLSLNAHDEKYHDQGILCFRFANLFYTGKTDDCFV